MEMTDRELLLRLMEVSGWNQSEVARQILVHRAQISKVLKEKIQLRPLVRAKIVELIQEHEALT